MKQKILVVREHSFLDPVKLAKDKSHRILSGLESNFEISNVFQMSEASQYFKVKRPDLVVLSLEKFVSQKIAAFQKMRILMKEIPILILCDELIREDRIEIHKISNTFAFQLDAEEKDLQKYLTQFRFQNPRARNFLRYKRSRELKLHFNNTEMSANFIDYSQTGAQIEIHGSKLERKMHVLVSYESKSTEQIRQIDSYVVWTEGKSRAGIQFLAVR